MLDDQPYPNTPGWSVWIRERLTEGQQRTLGIVETVVGTPSAVVEDLAAAVPAAAEAGGKGLGRGLSVAAIATALVAGGVILVAGVALVGAGVYFAGPELGAALAVAKRVRR